MKCLYCQGTLKKGTTVFHVDRKDCHLTLDNIPAWVCSQCGEALIEEKEVDAIQNLVRSIDENARALRQTA